MMEGAWAAMGPPPPALHAVGMVMLGLLVWCVIAVVAAIAHHHLKKLVGRVFHDRE